MKQLLAKASNVYYENGGDAFVFPHKLTTSGRSIQTSFLRSKKVYRVLIVINQIPAKDQKYDQAKLKHRLRRMIFFSKFLRGFKGKFINIVSV